MTPRPRGGVPFQVTPRHLQMAHAVLSRRGFTSASVTDYDDHVGACLLGLAKAAKRWDPSRGVSFENYAYKRMVGEHLDYLRTLDHLTRGERARVRAGEDVDPGPLVAPLEYLPDNVDPVDEYERVDLASAIEHATEYLTTNEAVVVRLCGLGEWTQVEAGVVLGVTESRVSQLNTSARRKLHGRLEPLLRDAA